MPVLKVVAVFFWVVAGVVKIAVYTDGILIPFLFHIFHIIRFQVSGVRNDEQRRWNLKPDTRHTGRIFADP
jgi:hypothetical protein